MAREEFREKLVKLFKDARICMLTTMTADGRHVSRPMALQEAEFDGDLWFFTDEDSDLVPQVRAHPQVNVAVSDDKHQAWISLSGVASVVYDRARAERLWSPALKAWFPDGLHTPGLTLIKVQGQSAAYWDAPNGRLVTAFSFAKAVLTGKRAGGEIADNEAQEL